MNAASGKPAELAEPGTPTWRKLLVVGWAMFAVSFFLPVASAGISVAGARPEPSVVWGWQAFAASLLMIDGSPLSLSSVLSKVSGLSNVLVLATLLKVRGRRPPESAWLAFGLAGATLVNLSWSMEASGLGITDPGIGYWVWVASFACIGLALRVRTRGREPVQAPPVG